jgi:hypothetical protein
LTDRQMGICRQDRPFMIEVESRGVLWSLVESRELFVESRPVTIEVGVLSESASYYDEVLESDDKVEFL